MTRAFSFLIILSVVRISINAQVSSSFEVRYHSKDKASRGITDFKGENEVFGTEQRIEFLDIYADVASKWFLDSALDLKVNTRAEIREFLEGLREKPLPDQRRRLLLKEWKKKGFKKGDEIRSVTSVNRWNNFGGVQVKNGVLNLERPNVRIDKQIDSLRWRFHLSWKARSAKGNVPMSIALKENNRIIAETGFHSNGNIFYTSNGYDRMGTSYIPGKWYEFRIEADLVNDRYNLYINGNKTADWASLRSTSLINGISITGGTGVSIDELSGMQFDTTGCPPNHPYHFLPFLREDFEITPPMEQWFSPEYEDDSWNTDQLPVVHGGAPEAGEDLYLRKTIRPGAFDKAWLNIESLDPGGEVWINGKVVFVTHERHPIKLDISEFLVPYQENTLAIRVYAYHNDGPLYHSPMDRNIGWFCGRTWIDLTGAVSISEIKVFTTHIDENATQHHQVVIRNDADTTFSGNVRIDYYPWHPVEESRKAVQFILPVRVFARDTVHLNLRGVIKEPMTWTHDHPNLYRVNVKLLNGDQMVDDDVITTGIRTVGQQGGIFRINGQPELLGGAQTMGFRMPVDHLAKWNRCPPPEILADELLACKKLGNTLRIHVHAGGKYAHSVNDPRMAEMADQLGIMLIWPTTAWIREGEWGGIDFEGYPQYMEQVFNHPSIVIWEGANHPNRFDGKPLEYSNRFISKIYNTIRLMDSSRLISPTSYNRHLAYRNDQGIIDRKGDPIIPGEEWTAPLIVRGNQDALTGYGAEWHNIRNWPDDYRKSFLESNERCYFNFEHEESIGMQNFELARGKPWYQMPSYENNYDVGSIGRELAYDEWRLSQAWQGFSAWESMKWQRMKDIDGFSWCCLHGGPNSGTYRKPLIDALGHAKIAFYTNQMALEDVMAGSDNPDVVYHKKDDLTPVIMNVGKEKQVRLKILIKTPVGEIIESREYRDITLEEGRTLKKLPSFRPDFPEEGYYVIEYYVLSA